MTALDTARAYAAAAREVMRSRVAASSLDTEQHAAHGLAWVETAVSSLEALNAWGARQTGDAEALVVAIGTGETLAQLAGGLPMGQNEFVRPGDFGLESYIPALLAAAQGNTPENRAALVALLRDGATISDRLDDELLDTVRDQYRRFTDDRILPHAHQWHLANALIPDEVIAEMAALGTFGVCISEEFGGLGLGKLVMCIVTEELSRGWIGTGSLGTRSEIAGELIMQGGTQAQKAYWLPKIASGEVLPTAVFTEPDTGSDMASLQTRAVRTPQGWEITGAKNWITHAARTDLMTLMARTVPDVKGYAGLSMLLVPKPRGSEENPFPADGMSGSEIEVLGYRGMREYALQFDAMQAPEDALLGGEEGQGFKQLMRTFEGARIQTAARCGCGAARI